MTENMISTALVQST